MRGIWFLNNNHFMNNKILSMNEYNILRDSNRLNSNVPPRERSLLPATIIAICFEFEFQFELWSIMDSGFRMHRYTTCRNQRQNNNSNKKIYILSIAKTFRWSKYADFRISFNCEFRLFEKICNCWALVRALGLSTEYSVHLLISTSSYRTKFLAY